LSPERHFGRPSPKFPQTLEHSADHDELQPPKLLPTTRTTPLSTEMPVIFGTPRLGVTVGVYVIARGRVGVRVGVCVVVDVGVGVGQKANAPVS